MSRSSWVRVLVAGILAGATLAGSAALIAAPPAMAQPGTQSLGEAAVLADGTRVTVHDAFATEYLAPAGDGYIYAVYVSICTGAAPSQDNRRATADHFDLIIPRMLSGKPVPGFFIDGFVDREIGPNECNEGWIAYSVPSTLRPGGINYHAIVCDFVEVGPLLPAPRCSTPPDGLWFF